MTFSRLSVGRSARTLLAAALLAAAGAASAQTQLLNASYDVAREFYKDINAAFVPAYKKATGKDVKTPTQENTDKKSSGFSPLQNLCTALDIFVAAAEKAGKDLNQHTWEQGLESLGKIALPTSPNASFGPNKPDGQDSFQLERQDPSWTTKSSAPEFIPIGKPILLTS